MLYPDAEAVPAHVPPGLIVDHDVFTVDAPDGDFAGAMVRLRDSGVPRLLWTPRNGGHWLALDGDDIRRILEDPETFSSRAMRVPKSANVSPPMAPLMIDPPALVAYRRLLAPFFTPAEVRRLEHRARAVCVALIEELLPRGGCEFVTEFSRFMPIVIFMDMLALPVADRPLILAIADRIVRPDRPETRMTGFAELWQYCAARIAERRADPGDDLLTHLATATIDGLPLSDAELQGLCTTLMLGGLDTVTAMLGFIAAFLARSPAHRAELRAHPERMTNAIEEFLRRMGMVNLTREVTRPVQLRDVTLQPGDLIVLATALCNFPQDGGDGLAVDFTRHRQPHATFGAGPHYCLGSMLARAEIRIFLEEWLPRIPDFAIAEGAVLAVKVGAAANIVSLPLVWNPLAG
ncbi:MAG: cytochrome P450 [Sphingomonadales bacterium]|nr:cytochrome P450 [Sphingomonadales bacterium]